MKDRHAARGAALATVLALLLLFTIVAVILVSGPAESQVNGSSDELYSGQGTTPKNPTSPSTNPGTSGGKSTNPSKPRNQTGPGPGAPAPSLPSGEAASHEGSATLTTTVSGQSYTIEVAVSVKLDQAGGYSFAYSGAGTVPVNFGANVGAIAEYTVNGSFSGTLDGEAFSGSGPASIQATVQVPGMSPQSGKTTEQLTIKGSMHEVGGGRLEGDFVGGSYAGTFWADAV